MGQATARYAQPFFLAGQALERIVGQLDRHLKLVYELGDPFHKLNRALGPAFLGIS